MITVLEDFLESNTVLAPFVKGSREAVCRYLQERAENKQLAKLDEVVHAASTVIPGELKDHLEGLLQHFNNDLNRVPSEFHVHKGELAKHIKVVIDADDMQLKFNKSVLGTDVDAKVHFDRNARSLTIRNLTQKQMDQLNKQIA